MTLRNPWHFAFSNLYLAIDRQDISFYVRRTGRVKFDRRAQSNFAAAVMDGMLYDCGPDEFCIECEKSERNLLVHIMDPGTVDLDGKPDKAGVYWRRR